MIVRGTLAGFLALMILLSGTAPAAADTTADCGRFHLKLDKKTGKMKCVSGKRKRAGANVSVRAIRQQQRVVQRIIRQIQNFSGAKELTQEQRRRVRQLITEARQRIEQIKRQTSQLRQEQEQYAQEIANAARTRTRAQQSMSRQLEQQQRDLTRQLVAQQRQLQQSLERNNRGGQ